MLWSNGDCKQNNSKDWEMEELGRLGMEDQGLKTILERCKPRGKQSPQDKAKQAQAQAPAVRLHLVGLWNSVTGPSGIREYGTVLGEKQLRLGTDL